MNHVLKTHTRHFSRVWDESKPFEIRRNDREPGFAEGDWLFLQEWDPDRDEELNRWIKVQVSSIVHGPTHGLEEGYCVLGLDRNVFLEYGKWSTSYKARILKGQSRTIQTKTS